MAFCLCASRIDFRLFMMDALCSPQPMKEMIATLIQKADLNEEQATKVAEVIRGFLKDKLPDSMEGPVLAALSGDNVEDAVGKAKSLLSGLF